VVKKKMKEGEREGRKKEGDRGRERKR